MELSLFCWKRICKFLLCSHNKRILIETYYVNRVCMKWQEKRKSKNKYDSTETTSNEENPCIINTWYVIFIAEYIVSHTHVVHWITMQKVDILHIHFMHVNGSIAILAVTERIKWSFFFFCVCYFENSTFYKLLCWR